MTESDEQLEARLRARRLPGLSDEASKRLLADLADVARDDAASSVADLTATHSVVEWRWIVRHPISSISAALVLAIAVGAIATWFNGAGTAPAFADFIKPSLDAKTVTFTIACEGDDKRNILRVMETASPQRSRTEHVKSGTIVCVEISDDMGKTLELLPADRIAIVTTNADSSKKAGPSDIRSHLRSQLVEARDQSHWIREPLGERTLDGRRVVGFRLTGLGMIKELWADPKSGMLVRMETSMPSYPNMKRIIASDFLFNAHLDESLLSLEPPPGYEIRRRTEHASPPPQEKDLLEMFRRYAELRSGALPDQLDAQAFLELNDEDWDRSHPRKREHPSEEEIQEKLNAGAKLIRGLSFAFERLPREADAHYAGKGIRLGAADTPVFWYRPKDGAKYRIIYADLSVREADMAPSVPNAQPIVSVSGPKK